VRSLDRILVFDRGQIVEQGTHAALTARRDGIYRSLFDRQVTEFAQITAAE
jgi:ATP-binding cassette subfamily B protein